MNKQVLIGLSTLSLVTILSGVALSSSNSFAASASTATAAVKIPAACTFSGGGTYTATIPNGTSAEIAGSTLTVTCNDAGGFAIYAIGNSGDEYGNNNMIGNSTNIATGTSGTDSYWAMKITPTIGNTPTIENSFNSFHTVPSTQTKVASYVGSTGSGSLSVNATYKANISNTQLAGTYIGKVKYTLVHPASEEPLQPQPATAGCINYFANASSAIGEMGCQTATNNASVDLWASNFSRTGYGFAGWNDAFDYSGNFYGPNETITAPADVSTKGLSLYAVWIKSAGTIQNWNGCGSLASGATTALTDERDNNTYAVAKLADNKCWMIENLRLENTGIDNTNGSLAQGYNSSFIGLADPESANFSNSTTANSLYSTDGSTAATISGNYQGYRFPRYNNFNTNSRQSSSGYSKSGNTYSMGNYYTWHAAIADTTYYTSGDHNTTSICPAGWHIPTGVATTGEFALLDIALGGTGSSSSSSTDPTGAVMSSRYRSYPNNFLYSGYFDGSSANNRGSHGYYWSSTARGGYNSYRLFLNSSNVYPGTLNYYKYYGFAIRCTLGS